MLLFQLCLIFFLAFAVQGKEPDWLKKLMLIEPLKTSKQEVESIFKPNKINANIEENDINYKDYTVKGGKVTVVYSTGKCPAKENDDPYAAEIYRAEKDIVLEITFFPDSLLRFPSYKVKRKQLTKTTDGHDPGWNYIDTEQGIRYGVVNGYLTNITLKPSSKFSNLKCVSEKV